MRVAFTLDDVPLWPRAHPPLGFTVASIMQKISDGLTRNGIRGVYGFANSWALVQHPELGAVLDAWRADGHHVGNHTHSHLVLTEIGAERYCGDIDQADHHLARWMANAPSRFFRYALCHWGDTEEKRAQVLAHLAATHYRPVDVSSWWYEWHWNRAWRNAKDRGDSDSAAQLERSFETACVAQLRYDHATLAQWLGRDAPLIALGHTVPFFAEIAERLFKRLVTEDVEFIPLEDAAADPGYEQVGRIVSDKFLVYQLKLADASGRLLPPIAPEIKDVHEKVVALAAGPIR
jgi:peptidoglycan-N-acetylglucosamine deacetylase